MKISVVVPIYNVAPYLDKCLTSLVNQTFKSLEIILVNDGSTDSSLKIINKYAKKYKNIVVLNNTNHGQGYARNCGIEASTAPYIYFLDGDDYLELNTLEVMYEKITKDKLDVVVSNIYKVYESKKEIFINYINYSNESNINLMLSHQGIPAKLFKTSIFKENKIFFPEKCFYEDLAINPIIASLVKKVDFIDIPLYNYVIRKGSTMNQTSFNSRMNDIFTVLKSLEEPLKKYKDELEYLYIEHLLYSATLRYIDYEEITYLNRINDIFKNINFKNNKYYKVKSIKFKLVCALASKRKYKLLKLLKRISGK